MFLPSLVIASLTSALLQYATKYLGDGGMQCLTHTGAYTNCQMLMASIALTGLGAVTAIICIPLEWLRIKEWKKASTDS